MPRYSYKARDAQGKLIRGIIDAPDETRASLDVEKSGLIPLSITYSAGFDLNNLLHLRFRRATHQELLVWTRQLSTLIGTGAPLIQSLRNVSEQTDNSSFRQVINTLISSLESGSSFSEALAKFPDIFPNLYVSLVKVGEVGGLLDKVLSRLAELSTREIDLRSRIRAALIYPAVLAGIAFVIVNFVLLTVLPKFVGVFEASAATLPLPTRVLLGLSGIARNFWWLIGLAIVFGLSGFRKYYHSSGGRRRIDAMILKSPLFGPLILKVMVSSMSRSIAALVQSGVPVLDALTAVESTISNAVLQKMIQNTRRAISQGQSLTEPFKESRLFPPMVIQLINTGERTGRLDEMFNQIADFYEPEIDFTVRNLTSLLEPVMLLVMGVIVAFIALSVLLPIFNLINIIKR